MSDFIPTEAQAAGITAIKDWYHSLHYVANEFGHPVLSSNSQQVFRLFGFAGAGKSTLVSYVIEELDLGGKNIDGIPHVMYGTYTGKAAYVLRKKGVPCQTIHSLIYSVSEATEQQIREATEQLMKLEIAALSKSGVDRMMAMAEVEAKRMVIKEMKRPQFRLNPHADVADCKLLVLDEVSMVDDGMAADVLSFGKPVLVLGDPGQLPPIRGAGAFTNVEPDIMLTEIHRQAEESAIIRLATMAREGRPIPYGMHDEHVYKMQRGEITADQMLRADQVICGKNATRLDLNNAMRSAAGRKGTYPIGPEEKVICLKNNNKIGLINGMFLRLSEVEKKNEIRFSALIETESGNAIGHRSVYAGHFIDHENFDADRLDRDWKQRKDLVEATFGYAITCHKAQGSQFENIIVWDDHLSRTDIDRRRWLYTAITRAERGLVILD